MYFLIRCSVRTSAFSLRTKKKREARQHDDEGLHYDGEARQYDGEARKYVGEA